MPRLASSTALLLFGLVIPFSLVGRAEETPPDAAKPIVLTEKDHQKTIAVRVGQSIEVRLTNPRPGAGWESAGSEITGASVVRAATRREGNCDEFLPADKSDPKTTVGTYVYRYTTVQAGASSLRLTRLFPSGPTPVRRSATQFLGEFKATLAVVPN